MSIHATNNASHPAERPDAEQPSSSDWFDDDDDDGEDAEDEVDIIVTLGAGSSASSASTQKLASTHSPVAHAPDASQGP